MTGVEGWLSVPSGVRVREAALQLFARKGYEATGIREIANAAGISVATLYNYVQTKEDLLVGIVDHGTRRLIWATRAAMEGTANATEALEALVRIHVWSHGTRQLSALVADTEVRSLRGERLVSLLALRDEYQGLWHGVLSDGIAENLMTVSDVRLATFALLQMCTGVSHWYRSDGPMSLEVVCDNFVAMCLSLVSAVKSDSARVPSRLSASELEDLLVRAEVALASGESSPD